MTEIDAAMATRDLMSATQTLAELPPDLLENEYDDIALSYAQLGRVLENHSMRRLRQRACGHSKAILHSMAMREISETERA